MAAKGSLRGLQILQAVVMLVMQVVAPVETLQLTITAGRWIPDEEYLGI
jgi:hypothetical protein